MSVGLKKLNPFIFLLLAAIFGYWQIAFCRWSLKWDAIDVVFPFRFFFSECIQSGYFPFWNPYQQTGTPFFADLQAPTFYPELLLTSLFSGYGIYTMHFLFVLYAFLAATGMYQLSFYFNQNREASFMAGIAYAFSGFFVGHGQHFFLLVGAAWIPFVMVNYLKLQESGSLIQALKTAVFIFLMISGAYQALSFTLFYLLTLFFIFFFIKTAAKKNFIGLWQIVKANLWLFLFVVLFSLPLIISTLEILTSVERLESGIDLVETSGHGQSFKSVISFLIPFSTLQYGEFFGGVDVSMRNHYFGLIPFLFFIAALLQKRTVPEYLILGFGVLIFAASFSFLPVRELLFNHVPFMNLFKYAAFLRIFGLLSFILLAANYFAYFRKNRDREKKQLTATGILILLVLLFLIVYALTKIGKQDFLIFWEQQGWTNRLHSLSFYQHVLFQALFQLFVCVAFLLVIWHSKKLKYPGYLIVLIIVAEMVTATQLNMSITVGDPYVKPGRMKRNLSLYPEGFPVPLDCKVIFNDQRHELFPPFWRNTYVFSKQIAFSAFSSFELDTYSKLDDDFPNLRDAVLNNHLFYFSDRILPLSQFNDTAIDRDNDAEILFFRDKDFEQLSVKPAKTHGDDKLEIIEFSPNRVVVTTETRNDQFLTMLQTHFNGWKAYIDDEVTPLYTSNFNYRTIYLPNGKHRIRFEYENRKIKLLYIFSNSLFFLALLFLAGRALRKKNLPGSIWIFIPLMLLSIMLFFLAKRLTYQDRNLTIHQIYAERLEEKKKLFHLTQDFENEIENSDTLAFSGRQSVIIDAGDEYFPVVRISHEDRKLHKCGTLVITAKVYPEEYSRALIVSDVMPERASDGWHASKLERQIERLHEWNDVLYFRNFYDLKESEEIVVYFWNLNQDTFRVDAIEAGFYPF